MIKKKEKEKDKLGFVSKLTLIKEVNVITCEMQILSIGT